MDTLIKVRLKPSVLRSLEQRAQELKTDADTVINKALEDYFYVERLNALRQRLNGQAQNLGFETEEDIFGAIS